MKNKKNSNEVRSKSVSLFISIPILCVIAIILIFTHHYLLIVFPSMMCVYIILSFLNEKLLYSGKGITFCDFLGKKRFIPWENIVSIEDTYEDPQLSRGVPGRILKIKYRYKYRHMRERTEVFKLSYSGHIGIEELVSFYMNQIHQRDEFSNC